MYSLLGHKNLVGDLVITIIKNLKRVNLKNPCLRRFSSLNDSKTFEYF